MTPRKAPQDCHERKAAGIDEPVKKANLARLRRIEGQVRGLQRLVEEDRYCPDILVQVSAVQEALRAVSRELVGQHLRHCVRSAIESGGPQGEEAIEELARLLGKTLR